MVASNRDLLLQRSIFTCYVSFRECNQYKKAGWIKATKTHIHCDYTTLEMHHLGCTGGTRRKIMGVQLPSSTGFLAGFLSTKSIQWVSNKLNKKCKRVPGTCITQ